MIVSWVKDNDTVIDFEVNSVAEVADKARELGFIQAGNWGYDDEYYTLPGEDGCIMISAPLIRG